MRLYYDEWKTSNHNEVPCVQCHIPPLEEPRFLPDFRALGQVVSYLTRTYSRHTRAEVEDKSCLREDCHSHRLLEGRVVWAADITFDHVPHLQRLRRGKILRCTTCHSRIAMGQHVSVVQDPCFLCHFKDDGTNLITAECRLCHDPEHLSAIVDLSGFGHEAYLQRDVPCDSCHDRITRGDGQVEGESCGRCHEKKGPENLEESVEQLHRSHVTDHKVECGLCHEPIRHDSEQVSRQGVDSCGSCHQDKHASILNLYQGTGALGILSHPSPMYIAKVGCRGCHRVSETLEPGEGQLGAGTLVAIDAACSKCHGSDLSGKVEKWNDDIAAALAKAETSLKRAEDRFKDSSKGVLFPEAEQVLEQARHNILFVRVSSPIHNIDYALKILEKATSDLNGLLAGNIQR